MAFANAEAANVCDITVAPIPTAWRLEKSEPCLAVLYKRFEYQGYWYNQHMNIQASSENYEQLQSSLDLLIRLNGFLVVDKARIGVGQISAPLWLLYKTAQSGESMWLAFVLHNGLTYTIAMRANALDVNALGELGQVLSAIQFRSDEREEAWLALANGQPLIAAQKFATLLEQDQNDTNARYGYGLAELARGALSRAEASLERAGPELGVSEDIRRPLGRIAYARHEYWRAAALWTQVIRDNPRWDAELRPWIIKAARRAGQGNRNDADFGKVVNLGAMALHFLQATGLGSASGSLSIGNDEVDEIRQQLQSRLTRVLDDAARQNGGAVNPRAMIASLDLERGLAIMSSALRENKYELLVDAQLMVADAMSAIGQSDDRFGDD